MSALMPNSSGVYPNSVAGFNASIANQSAPRPDAFGSFGTDPITGASYTDKASAQAALGQYANPNSNASRYLRSMQPTMLPTGGGQGGGGGGRMGAPRPRNKITRVGPRTSSEYIAEKGGLTPMRPSTLDAAYGRGDLTNPNAPAAPRPTAAPNIPPPINDSFAGGAGMGAGAAVGNMMTPALLGVGKVTAQNIAQGEGKVPVYYDGGIDNMGTVPKAGTVPLDEIGEYNPQEYAKDSVSYALDALPGGSKAPTMLAKGGPMKIGQKPYLVGEEGPELIMPRANGDGYVLPADVTQQLLPMMTKRPTPRQQGGIMEMNTPTARFAGGATPYGPTFAMQQREDQINSAEFTEQERELAQQPDQRMIVDNGYQVDLPALRAGGSQSIPLQPDVVTGPWASRAMPADTTGLQPYLQNQVSRLSMTGAKPISKYPGQTFNDTSAKSFLEYGNAMPGDTVEQLEARTRQYQQGLRDPYAGSAGSGLTFEEMQQRMALRGMMYGDDYRDRQNRDRVQQDLANRAARAPLGTPTMLPGQGSEARIAANLARERERLSRTPQGAQFLAQQQQEMDMLAQRSKLASTAIPVKDAAGNILGYTTGTGASLPNLNNRPRQVQRTVEVDGTMYNVYEDGSAAPISGLPTAAPKQQFIDQTTGRIVEFDADIDTSSLDENQFKPVSRKPTPATPGTATADPTAPVAITSPDDIKRLGLKPGTPIILPSGKRSKVPAP
jgi:hypothetical protein